MANELAKYLSSRRRLRDQAAIKRQAHIAKSHGFSTGPEHRLAKTHATTCGDSNCAMCGNPRKFFKEKTIQEQRQEQEVDRLTDRHSNGLAPNE
jgi:hypothetical protein